MPRFVQHHVDVSGQGEHDGDPVTLVLGLTVDLNTFRLELPDGCLDVVAHQGELVANARFEGRALGWVHAELCRGQREDQPAFACIDVLPAEYITERRPERLGFARVEQDVRADNRHAVPYFRPDPAAAAGRSSRVRDL